MRRKTILATLASSAGHCNCQSIHAPREPHLFHSDNFTSVGESAGSALTIVVTLTVLPTPAGVGVGVGGVL